MKQFELCEKLLDPHFTSRGDKEGACFHYHIGQCHGACGGKEDVESYNIRASVAVEAMNTLFEDDFFIIDKGRTKDERAVILVQNGHYQGFGYLDWEQWTSEDLFECIKKYPKSADCNKVIRQFMSKNKGLKIVKI